MRVCFFMGVVLGTDSEFRQKARSTECWIWLASIFVIGIAVLTLVYQFREKTEESSSLQRFEFTQVHMAMPVTLTVWAEDAVQAESACKSAFERIADLTRVFSDYDRRSETTRVNRLAVGESTLVSQEFGNLLELCKSIHGKTEGRFDPTAGYLVQIWRTARRRQKLPEQFEIDQALTKSGFESLRWSTIAIDREDLKSILETNEAYENSTLLIPGSAEDDSVSTRVSLYRVTRVSDSLLDFGAVAKGYIGDETIDVLREHSIGIACYEAGGDIVCSAAPPGTDGWAIDVAGVGSTLRVANCAVAASGDTEQSVTIDGKTYSHVIDLSTGWGITNRRMVTVKASRGAISDALATTGCAASQKEFQSIVGRFQSVEVLNVTTSE